MMVHTDTMALEKKMEEEFKKLNDRMERMEATDHDVVFMAQKMDIHQQQAVIVVGPPAVSDEMVQMEEGEEEQIQLEEEDEVPRFGLGNTDTADSSLTVPCPSTLIVLYAL
ncbi:hypothetical protein CRE_08429 [Caenorhabditis remanei]|uniref:Uncharacterized protein n=1 Tax=Caenorhabditis remanei TaxID=31234 RepID=E3MZZ0_CAERE|nr:hypothetical protein CRE_08429 [Caenorhabditis remanei]